MSKTVTAELRRVKYAELAIVGWTLPQIAEQLECSLRQAQRIAADPLVRAELKRLRTARLERLVDITSGTAIRALNTLVKVASESESDGARVSAARALLDVHLRLVENVELSDRLLELEARATEREGRW